MGTNSKATGAARFTAGPWEVRTLPNGERCVAPYGVASTLFGVAWTLPPDEITPTETIDANAALIAAAPAMFEALEGLLGRMRWNDTAGAWEPNEIPGERRVTRATLRAARAALALARGEAGR